MAPQTTTGRPSSVHVLYGEESQSTADALHVGKSRAAMAVRPNTEDTCMPVTHEALHRVVRARTK